MSHQRRLPPNQRQAGRDISLHLAISLLITKRVTDKRDFGSFAESCKTLQLPFKLMAALTHFGTAIFAACAEDGYRTTQGAASLKKKKGVFYNYPLPPQSCQRNRSYHIFRNLSALDQEHQPSKVTAVVNCQVPAASFIFLQYQDKGLSC